LLFVWQVSPPHDVSTEL